MQEPFWIFASASVIGNSHILENIPCQDFCKIENNKEFSIAVVCDGAGSCSNSQIGSKQVAEFSINYFEKVIRRNNWHTNLDLPLDNIWHSEAKKTLRLIKEDLEKYSLNYDLDFKSLSCTVIIKIALPNGLLVTHIGDGRAGYCNMENEWKSSITPFHGELANQTVFITSEIWNEEIIDTYIKSNVIRETVNAFCLMSDGCEKASFECNLFDQESETYFDPNKPYPLFFNPIVQTLINLKEQNQTQEEINTLWENFLTHGNERLKIEPDDKTMILAARIKNNIDNSNE